MPLALEDGSRIGVIGRTAQRVRSLTGGVSRLKTQGGNQ